MNRVFRLERTSYGPNGAIHAVTKVAEFYVGSLDDDTEKLARLVCEICNLHSNLEEFQIIAVKGK